MELDILLRGQSNAFLFVSNDFGGIAGTTLVNEVQRLLGFDGSTDRVRLRADWYTPGQETIHSGTRFIGDWVRRDAQGQWQALDDERSLLTYIDRNPQPQAAETAIVWLHSEYDSWLNPGLTAAEWESAVRADAAWVRDALGIDAARSPYAFVSAIPFLNASDSATQAIRLGMERLAADEGFNALIGARALDIDMRYKFPGETTPGSYGLAHMSRQDTVQTAQRLARSLAEEWADHARPGSPVARAAGNIAEDGPRVTGARLEDAQSVLVLVSHDRSAGFAPLDPDAATGLGWSVRSGSGSILSDRAEVVSADTLRLHFADAVPVGGVLSYGDGYGRLAEPDEPGRGNAIYDKARMPLWVPAEGIAVLPGSVPQDDHTRVSLTVGSGPDALVLSIAQDAYLGDALYTVAVDGVRVGGTLAASALHASGQHDTVTVRGDWATGNHTATVTFLNDAWGGTATTDRNLHVEGATYAGAAVPGAARSLLAAGPASFGFRDPGLQGDHAPTSLTVGNGPDALVLRINQDAWQGDAQYAVTVDGARFNGVFTASALRSSGQADTLTLRADWAAGTHRVEVTFLNDAWGGTPETDRNLFVPSAIYDGVAIPDPLSGSRWGGAFTFTDDGI